MHASKDDSYETYYIQRRKEANIRFKTWLQIQNSTFYKGTSNKSFKIESVSRQRRFLGADLVAILSPIELTPMSVDTFPRKSVMGIFGLSSPFMC